jgi:hypothetical protein
MSKENGFEEYQKDRFEEKLKELNGWCLEVDKRLDSLEKKYEDMIAEQLESAKHLELMFENSEVLREIKKFNQHVKDFVFGNMEGESDDIKDGALRRLTRMEKRQKRDRILVNALLVAILAVLVNNSFKKDSPQQIQQPIYYQYQQPAPAPQPIFNTPNREAVIPKGNEEKKK